MRSKQIQARRVAVAAPQTEFPRLCFGAAYSPIAQGESHFLYERQERDNDLRASCRSSDSGGLPPSPFRTGPKQIQARPIVVGVVQIEATLYQQSRVGVFRGHFCMCNCRELGVSINLCRAGGPSVVIPLRLEWTAGLLTQGIPVGFTLP